MRTSIANTDFYSIEIDSAKNRGYLTFYGFCRSPEEIPDFLKDVKMAGMRLKKGFTLLTDATEMKTPPEEVSELHEKSQEIWIRYGLSKTAEIIPQSAVVRMTLNRLSKTTGMKKQEFDNKQAAESWLDTEDV
jgi:hypothetical protein